MTAYKYRAVCAVVLVFASATLSAADLRDIYALASGYDAEFKAAQAAYRATLETKPQALADLLPQINLNGSGDRTNTTTDGNFFGQVVNDQKDSEDSSRLSLQLDQAIFHRDFYIRLRQADADVAQARATRDAAEQALMLRVAEGYFDILAAQDNLEFASAEKEAIGRQLEQAQKRFEVGLIAITDVKEAQASFDLAVAQKIDAQNLVETAREALRVIAGQVPEELSTLSDEMQLSIPEPTDIDEWVGVAKDENLDLIAARFATETARLEVDRRRSGHYPTLDLVARKTLSTSDGGISGSRDTDEEMIGLQANLPIYLGGAVSSRTREAHHRFRQTQQVQEQRERETVRDTRASYLNVKAGIARVQALKEALASSEAAAGATSAGFEVGTRTSADVLLALRETFRAQRDYARARYDYLLNTLRLKLAAGTLGAADLEVINRWLN